MEAGKAAAIIADNWRQVQQRVTEAAERSDRNPAGVHIIGVTKYVDASVAQHLVNAGCKRLGENRPQMLWQKAEALASHSDIQWHVIGHLQTNKLRRTMKLRPLIHSIDSERLLRAVEEEAAKQEQVAEVLLEVNISGDENKTGLMPDALTSLLETEHANVRIRGLMAMAGLGTDAAEAGNQFDEVRVLRDRLQQETGNPLPELSMGMTADFPEAIAAGATMVRIGSALFDGVR
ncbi:MAG: YggS family pyridoxal phosphate-dependent enzyme [Planctomycetota bacterium]